MKNGVLFGQSMRFITNEKGAENIANEGYESIVVDMSDTKVRR